MTLLNPNAVVAPSLHALLVHELKDLYDAEQQILDALPGMIDVATDDDLKHALREHRKETETQVKRLEQAFEFLNEEPERVTCAGMKGIIKEGEHIVKGNMDVAVMDIAIVAAAQRVEHYEMSAYTSICELARSVHQNDVANLLEETLKEEVNAERTLATIGHSMHKELS